MSDQSDTPRFPPDDLKVDFGEPAKTLNDPGFMARVRKAEREADERRERQMQERAAQARADALAAFVPRELGRTPNHWWTCPACAALVNDPEQHLDWHSDLAATAAQASHADMWTRPIG